MVERDARLKDACLQQRCTQHTTNKEKATAAEGAARNLKRAPGSLVGERGSKKKEG
jgi:hypothetical protein